MIINPSRIRIHSYQGDFFSLHNSYANILKSSLKCKLPPVSLLFAREGKAPLSLDSEKRSTCVIPGVFSLLFAGWKAHMVGIILSRRSTPNIYYHWGGLFICFEAILLLLHSFWGAGTEWETLISKCGMNGKKRSSKCWSWSICSKVTMFPALPPR